MSQLLAKFQYIEQSGICGILLVFEVFMVAGRLVSGVHWLTHIVGGILLSGGLVRLYLALSHGKEQSYVRKIYIQAGHCGGDPGGI